MVIVKRLLNFIYYVQGDINEDVKGILCLESCFNLILKLLEGCMLFKEKKCIFYIYF